MASIIILLGVIATFLGFALVMLCGIYSMLHDLKKDARKNNIDEEEL